ncbi:MAG TPA: N-acetyl-gamma-glutamyl-phosphate reductase [Steroidobacteraceae bacterium]|nr:N-acetyl-gamma-glutamyl-phosphate reductase [Steroidobacteraceae bacterium]
MSTPSNTTIPTIILGGTGYVAGELLRLVAGHPNFELAAILSDSQPGELVGKAFPHLAAIYPTTQFKSQDEVARLIAELPQSAIFGAAPHGVSHVLIDSLLKTAERAKTQPRVVDISADYRYSSPEAYATVYKHEHGAPDRIKDFTCALPEHLQKLETRHVAHPGCFASSALLASVPLLALNLVEPTLFLSGVTGSTGSGRKPVEGTHHPLRHSDLYSYNALAHRHTPEIAACAKRISGVDAEFAFVPHSGPFARGIHMTVQARLKPSTDPARVLPALREFYARAPFVRVLDSAPRLKDVVTSNYAHLWATASGRTVAVMCVLDNLNKGAAGGAVQWMNRIYGLPETAGLVTPAPGWT